jgi:hypothetical protein
MKYPYIAYQNEKPQIDFLASTDLTPPRRQGQRRRPELEPRPRFSDTNERAPWHTDGTPRDGAFDVVSGAVVAPAAALHEK